MYVVLHGIVFKALFDDTRPQQIRRACAVLARVIDNSNASREAALRATPFEDGMTKFKCFVDFQ